MEQLRTTPLTGRHHAAKAKMAPFAGFDMPVQYEGIMAEHAQTRAKACVFDICHMGEFRLEGPGSKDALNRVVTQDLDTLAPGKCRYGFLLNDEGGIQDDLIVYCLGPDRYMLVVNGACEENDFAWIKAHLGDGPAFENISSATGKIDLQGPESLDVLEAVIGGSWRDLKYFSFVETTWRGKPLIVSRTGYTGELGYEFYLGWDQTPELWESLLADARVKPGGLGARDTLRLELGYPLYGQDLDTAHTPVEAGYGAFLTKAGDYVGKAGLARVREHLVPLRIDGRRSARHNDAVCLASGEQVGVVTSGSFAPSLGHCIALAYVRDGAEKNENFVIKAARVDLPAVRAELPFYTQGTARKKLG
ncbi:glycine cleavage system aminomethyltransferase GcvT [Desulfovibrio aminophilus]|nr:glycine cleavage system aminomethyltransferase GcvT [Desulfovibrio aminophilus]